MFELPELPAGWFLWSLQDRRTRQVYRGDKHNHIDWRAELQHEDGGLLTSGLGKTAAEALDNAIARVNERIATKEDW